MLSTYSCAQSMCSVDLLALMDDATVQQQVYIDTCDPQALLMQYCLLNANIALAARIIASDKHIH
jgi:hypothetical protein